MNRWLWILVAMLLLAQGYGQLTPAPRFNLLRFFNSQIGARCQSVTETDDGRFMAVVNYTGECYLTKDAMVSLLYLQTPKWASGYYYQNAAFVTGMDSSGYVEWVHHIYSPDTNFRFYNSVTDAQQNLYLLGMLRDTVYIDDSLFGCTPGSNLLMVKIQPDGTIAWTKVVRSLEPGNNTSSYLVMVNQSLVLVNSGGRLLVDGDTLQTATFSSIPSTIPLSTIVRFDLDGNRNGEFMFYGGYTQAPLYRSIPVFTEEYVGLHILVNDTLIFHNDTMVAGPPTNPWKYYSAVYMFDTTFTKDTIIVKYLPRIYDQTSNHLSGSTFVVEHDSSLLNYSDSVIFFNDTIAVIGSGDHVLHFDSTYSLVEHLYFSRFEGGRFIYVNEFNQYIFFFAYDSFLVVSGDTLSVSTTDYSSAIIYYDTNFNPVSCKTLGDFRDGLIFADYVHAKKHLWVSTIYSYYALLDSVYYDGTYANYGESFLGRIPFHGIVGMDTVLKEGMWTLFPNPATDFVWIAGPVEPDKVEVMDMEGRIHEIPFSGNTINISGLPAGMYAIQVWRSGQVYIQKLVKVNP